MTPHRISRITLTGLAMALVVTAVCRAEEEGRKVIENGNSVSIEYTLKLDDGTTVDSNVGQDPLTYTQGKGEILPALEEALLGQAVGDTSEIALTAEQGYGPRNPEAFQEVAKDSVPEDARTAGMMLMATTTEGQQIPVRIQEVRDETIVLDFNHPLAGQALNFEVKVVEVDEASVEASE
jgi:FKBP-type peptidyl-prolyl cis-trans isomerase 2